MANTNTSCKNCIFAKYEDITQVGCHLNLLENYQTLGIDVQEAYDNEKEFYMIPNKFCSSYRTVAWEHNGIGLDKQRLELRRENQISYIHVIMLNEEETLQELQDNIKSVIECNNIKPEIICVIKNIKNTIPNSLIHDVLKQNNIPWMLRVQTDADIPTRTLLDMFLQSYPYKKYQYYVYMDAGEKLDNRFMDYINYAINNEMMRFGVIGYSCGGEILIANKIIHTYLSGNKSMALEQKIANTDKSMGLSYLELIRGKSYENFMSKQ